MISHIDLLNKNEILWPNSFDQDTHNLVWRIAHESWGKKMCVARHQSDTLLLGYVLNGCIQMSNPSGQAPIEAHQIFVAGKIPRGVLQTLQSPAKVYVIETNHIGNSLAEKMWGSCWLRLAPQNHGRIRDLFERAMHTASAQRLRCRQQTGLITQEILLALEEEHAEQGVDVQRQNFERCRQLIHKRYLVLNTAAQVAEVCGYTPEHLSRLFRKYQNTGVYEYLIQLKISASCQELLYGGKSVAAVAEKFGFSNPYTFSRTFTRIMGLRPGAYSRQTRK